ncbi:MAG: type II secretion system major pseudopilin GspG [Bryobacteraceae bacterium]
MKTHNRKRTQAGVTLIEMMVVVIIIALFAVLVGPRLFQQVDKAKIVKARTDINGFEAALVQYHADNGFFPPQEQGLDALRPYLRKDVPLDPWNHPYVYKFPGEHGEEPDIISYGADGQPGGEGTNADIVNWK